VISARAIAEARHEILNSSSQAIEMSTATKWAARAIAAYRLASDEGDLTRFAEACDFHHEAVEHASGVSPLFLANIVGTLGEVQAKTIAIFEGSDEAHEEEG
jgi:hypothetical protein